jgi:hypothetical protein
VRGRIVALFVELARDDTTGLVVLVTLLVLVTMGRATFEWRARRAPGRSTHGRA